MNEDSNTATASRNADAGAGAGARTAAGPQAAAAGCVEERVRRYALSLGFSACGLTGAEDLDCGALLARWLESGRHGSMDYLASKHEQRLRPSLAFAGARSAVVVAWSYAGSLPPDPLWRQSLRGRVAAYAIGRDYHLHVAAKLEKLAAWIREQTGADSAVFVDGGPLVEKELARRAGIGWYGRNTNLLRPGLGSTFVLGTILTAAALEPDRPFAADHCGTCRACIPACPTGALDDGPAIDARLCISYLTIEHRGPIPRELRPKMGNWVFGCDVCQDVCPWNEDGAAAHPLQHPWLPGWLQMSEQEFRDTFAATALLRPKRRGLARNAAIALGNTGNPVAGEFLARALREHDEPLVRAHSAWALGQLGDASARAQLHSAASSESVPPVRREIDAALAAVRGARAPLATNPPT